MRVGVSTWKRILLGIILFTLGAETVFAYIDPGTGRTGGGAFWPLIVPILSGMAALVVNTFWNPLKSYATGIFYTEGKLWKQRLKIALTTGLIVGAIVGIVDSAARIAALNFEWFELSQNLLLSMVVFAAVFLFLGLVMEAGLFMFKRQFSGNDMLPFHVTIALFLLFLFYGEILVYYYLLPPDIKGQAATTAGRAAVFLLSFLMLAALLFRRGRILVRAVSFLKKQETQAVLGGILFVAIVFILSSLVIDHYLLKAYTFPTDGARTKDSPNVILVALDTVGADHLTTYGYHRDTMPNLDRFAQESVVFDNAFSPSSWTVPSHASYFTGKYSENLGALLRDFNLESGETTLAEILQAEGYATAGFSASTPIKEKYGWGQGFQTYRDREDHRDLWYFGDWADFYWDRQQFRRFSVAESLRRFFPRMYESVFRKGDWKSEDMNRHVFSWLDRVRDRPFFLFINYFDAHDPYTLGGEFRSRFANDSLPADEVRNLRNRISSEGALRNRSQEIEEGLLGYAITLYDSELFYLDKNLGDLFDKLAEVGLMDDSLIIITSDHGEEFFEHGGFGHGETLYEEVLHVPFIIRYPELFRPARIGRRVETANILPTVLDILGIEAPDDIDSVSLVPLLKGEPGFERDSTYALLIVQYDDKEMGLQSVTHNNWKLIEVFPEIEGVPSSLFNLEEDSEEQENLYEAGGELRAELRSILANLTRYSLWSQEADGGNCAQITQSFLRDMCYFDPAMAAPGQPPTEFSCAGPYKMECDNNPALRCRSIENPYLAYNCYRTFFHRIHMKEFATIGRVGADVFIPDVVENCGAFAGLQKLFCIYLQAASLAKSNLSEAARICRTFEDERFIGECDYYIAVSLAMGLAEDVAGTASSLMALCGNVSYPLWRSECYYVVADELTLLPESDLEDIALACKESSAAHEYWCNNHVVFEMPPERAKEYCTVVDEEGKVNCILGLGESLTTRFIDNISLVVKACNETPPTFRKYCFEGIGRRLHESTQDNTWRIEQCNSFPAELPADCRYTLGEKTGYFARNVTSGLTDCNLFSLEPRERCLHELSWRVGEKVSYDVPLALEECGSFPSELQEECYQDLFKAFGRGFYNNIPAGIEKCRQFPAEFREECLQVLSQTLGERLSANRELGMETCDALQQDMRESCIHGLLCGFEPCDLNAQ